MKDILADAITKEQKKVAEFRKQYGSVKVGEVTVDMVINIIHYLCKKLSYLCQLFSSDHKFELLFNIFENSFTFVT